MSELRKPLSTHQVCQWPEFKAFMEKAGLNSHIITNLTIRLPMRGMATFEMEALLSDEKGVERR